MSRRHRYWCAGLLIASLVGCHSPTPQEQMQTAQSNLISEAVALQRCEADNGFASQRCADERATYNRDLAAFRAKYGR